VRELADGCTWNSIAGQSTDDSEMALLLARMLAEGGTGTRRRNFSAGSCCQKSSKSLREELVEYRQTNIAPNFPDQTKGILRDEVLDRLVRLLPLTREEFYTAVPMNLRQHTDSQQMQYLDDILEIIDAYA